MNEENNRKTRLLEDLDEVRNRITELEESEQKHSQAEPSAAPVKWQMCSAGSHRPASYRPRARQGKQFVAWGVTPKPRCFGSVLPKPRCSRS